MPACVPHRAGMTRPYRVVARLSVALRRAWRLRGKHPTARRSLEILNLQNFPYITGIRIIILDSCGSLD